MQLNNNFVHASRTISSMEQNELEEPLNASSAMENDVIDDEIEQPTNEATVNQLNNATETPKSVFSSSNYEYSTKVSYINKGYL